MSPHPDSYPTLTVRQPWADLILCGIQDVENRSWSTKFRGRLLIHGAKTVEWHVVDYLTKEHGFVFPQGYRPRTGAILGSVEVTDCVTDHQSRFFQGPFGLALSDPRHFERPVTYRGRLGIFNVPARHLEPVASEIQGSAQVASPSLQ